MSGLADDPRIRRGMETQMKGRRERIRQGDASLGWKVGFGAPAAMERLKIAAPLVGSLTRAGAVASGGTVSLAGWAKPVAEPEIALYLGKDLPAGSDREAAKAAIAGLGPAIELVDLDRPPDEVEQILSGNIYHRHVVLGPRDTGRAGGKLAGLSGRIFRRGVETASTDDVQANTGELIGLLLLVADTVSAFGERLRAGEIVICGAIVPPVFLDSDEESFSYELAPVGRASVNFRHGKR